MQPLKIQLFPKTDTDGQVFHIGKLRSPIKIMLGKGTAFIIFIDDEIKELHIASARSTELYDVFRYYKQGRRKASRSRHTNIAVELESRAEKLDKDEVGPARKFYIGRLDIKAEIDASDGIVFLIFTADPDEEELQISLADNKKPNKSKKMSRKAKESG